MVRSAAGHKRYRPDFTPFRAAEGVPPRVIAPHRCGAFFTARRAPGSMAPGVRCAWQQHVGDIQAREPASADRWFRRPVRVACCPAAFRTKV